MPCSFRLWPDVHLVRGEKTAWEERPRLEHQTQTGHEVQVRTGRSSSCSRHDTGGRSKYGASGKITQLQFPAGVHCYYQIKTATITQLVLIGTFYSSQVVYQRSMNIFFTEIKIHEVQSLAITLKFVEDMKLRNGRQNMNEWSGKGLILSTFFGTWCWWWLHRLTLYTQHNQPYII